MHATLRRIKTRPGQVGEVASLIETQYVPQIEAVPGFVSYTLVDLGDDEISSVGVFQDRASADRANDVARSWTSEVLAPYVATPLEAAAGSVLVDHRG
ncbi:antibiotic biosynthesis monooxygenase [uncultured Friedmanniella sp.]|uniref:antibiotic biosynthesis monooxygenase n=1 Tax=uncultured Friedmanniella sp. TaxID=335381 RepID=UPI0035CC7D68